MNDKDIEIAALNGEIDLLHSEIDWWAAEMDFWRCKYLRDHPEHDNWDYVMHARELEGG